MRQPLLFTALLAASSSAGALTGTVTDADGQPISGATVDVVDDRRALTTDASGRFAAPIDSVDELHISAPGYSHKVVHLHGEPADDLQVVLQRTVMQQVDVIGLPLHLSVMESAQPMTVISGEQLRNKQASTLGETLKNEVGVHSSYFGPVASSPIIRGLSGPRVLISQNGLDAGDASRVGPDHAVATEASTAQQIEILRGPATLFYGSGAIGGVVNIVDDRVPQSNDTAAAFALSHNTVASEDEFSAAYTGGKGAVAVHVDGFWRDSEDYKIPSAALAENEAAHEHEEHGEHEDDHEDHRQDTLANSAVQSHGFNIGASLLLERGFVGLSFGRLDRLNGIPGHGTHGEEEGHQQERVLSDMRQDRWQMHSELYFDGDVLAGINTRIGFTDYQHREIHQLVEEHAEETAAAESEEDTVFTNRTWQARADLRHQELRGWRGAVSIEGKTSRFKAIGAEAFTSPSTTDSVALALMEEKHLGELLWQIGGRLESVHLSADPIELESHQHEGEHELVPLADMDFRPHSMSAGLIWDYASGYKASAALSYSQRAPTAAELYALGPHIGAGTYEVGALFELHEEGTDVHLDLGADANKETANNIELSLRKHQGDVGFVLNGFYNQISDFYYQRHTGLSTADLFGDEPAADEEDHLHDANLPVYAFTQADASFYGFEGEFVWQFAPSWTWTLWGDSIHGELDSGEYIPRLPPKRLGNQFNYERHRWHLELSAVRYFEQDKVAANETTTPGYTMLDAHASYQLPVRSASLTLFAKAENLTNEPARVHSSFIKDRAPLPARAFTLGLRGRY